MQCTSFSDCRVAGQVVVSCMDPNGTHMWPSQRIEGTAATCVTPQQSASMPGQELCKTGDGEYVHWGMDLTWEFMRRYSKPG